MVLVSKVSVCEGIVGLDKCIVGGIESNKE